MKCPVCTTDLSPYSYGAQTIDICDSCRGIWFDDAELNSVAEQMIQNGQVADQEAEKAFKVRPRVTDGDELQKMCPRCNVPTDVVNYSYDSNVFLNRCGTCQGMWADEGELQSVAKHIKGNPAVNRFAASLLDEVIRNRKPNLVSRLLRSRILSGFVALFYLGLGLVAGESEYVWRMAIFLVLPLACIWFSDAMGGYTGVGTGRGVITQRSPGVFVAFAGWILLLSPIIVGVVVSLLQMEIN